jgi:hypothetical protein
VKKAVVAAVLIAGSVVVVAVAGISHSPAEERGLDRCSASSPLRTLTSAQADFRACDRDGNGVNDFWRKDVAGLYGTPGIDKQPVRLTELRVALADDNPKTDLSAYGRKAPLHGYWVRAILHEDEDPAKPDPKRFSYVMFPADIPNPPKYTFIVDENNTIFRATLPKGSRITRFPEDLSTGGWSKLD